MPVQSRQAIKLFAGRQLDYHLAVEPLIDQISYEGDKRGIIS